MILRGKITFLAIIVMLFIPFGCKDKVFDQPVEEPEEPPSTRPGCPFKHVEIDDTTRSYIFRDGNVHLLTPSYVDVRFKSGTSDSAAIALAAKYGLRLKVHWNNSTMYVFCVPEGKRAQPFFTPYGKSHIKNFGNEPLVEVAFGLFDGGLSGYLGTAQK